MVNSFRRATHAALFAATLAGPLFVPAPAQAEPAACLSPDPKQWPSPSKPYFMLVVDNSGSMGSVVGSNNSCGYQNNRIGHARCAVKNTVNAFGGEVNFGLGSYAWKEVACSNATCGSCIPETCFPECTPQYAPSDLSHCGQGIDEPTLGLNIHSGGYVVVPMLQDHYWALPPDPTNAPSILTYVDNNCGNSELGANGNTPLGGTLFNMHRYFSGTYTDQFTGMAIPTPIGTAAQGERPCRSVNIILITDGDESCDTYNLAMYSNKEGLAVYEAGRLFGNGVTVGGQTFKIKVHVIGFIGATIPSLNNIANAGGTNTAYSTLNEAQLSAALANIISSAIKPETCDNADNNCNGCTDEGHTKYCDIQPVAGDCCVWNTDPERTTCLTTYQASINAANPSGNLALLPCTTAAQQQDPLHWLCYDPTEKCDFTDNNCNGTADEGIVKCGSPLHCPQPEVCDGTDDNCNGFIDENACSGCSPSPEVCDGCDNDCDGTADDGVGATFPCGLTGPGEPPNCAGVLTCKAATAVPIGTCVANGGFNPCNNSPQTEICDNLDNDCNGIVDDNVASAPCGQVGGLNYGPNSQCKAGHTVCANGVTTCVGVAGPGSEICDGIDNNCDGTVDNGIGGLGQSCGVNQPPCTPGTTACVGGVIVCQGGVGPQTEKCDGLDNNCNGSVDESPLSDGPAQGMNGCWANAGNCCSFPPVGPTLFWCPPANATCNGTGTLTAPCAQGTLVCAGGAWTCQNPKGPATEVCDGLDNNCNGQLDDGVPLVGTTCGTNVGACTAGVYQCSAGVLSCNGGVGPTTEVCNGLDDDCDGLVDENVPGTGGVCGNATPPCSPGVVACVGGALVCQGGVGPQPEACNGVDDNCNGQIDEGNLIDAPGPGQSGCWGNAGNCCVFHNLQWCPPAGGTCSGNGTLTVPCGTGTLMCVSGAWACQMPKPPGPESCDGIDNNCDGLLDNVAPTTCVPAGTPPGLVYGGSSQCKQGTKTCGICTGFVGQSAELCDGIDNNCNGVVDDGVLGLGAPCGVNQPPCLPGATACMGGAIVCLGGVGPQPEICDGIDNNCDGTPDNAPLADAPAQGMNGCWSNAGNCCTFQNLTWCPPAGANCNDKGALAAPCTQGTLACSGAGWVCQSPKVPIAEVCDGVDNDCNGTVDDGNFPQVGQVCGSNVGECIPGKIACAAGVLDCAGDVGPSPEFCDGLDNDCDGTVDNGLPTGGPCTASYDVTAYPGPRTNLPCQPGQVQCNGMGGVICVGGLGPQPEVCDGIDNDCDGMVDEVGPAPDGIDGSANQFPPPDASIGDACGLNKGACKPGQYACINGSFACLGGQAPVEEVCDCADNNCDGAVDNPDPKAPPICSAMKSCVATPQGCQCASPCANGEFKCPPGQKCEQATDSMTGKDLGSYCVIDYDAVCGDCTKQTVKDANSTVLCAPAGTVLANCVTPPVCVCKGPTGCNEPCFGVTCAAGQVCANSGPNAGKCGVDNCWNNPCQGCNKACNLGACIDNPCTPLTCSPFEECKPNATFTGFTCVPSCAGVTCPAGKECADGVCILSCLLPCKSGEVCDTSPNVPTCVPDKCLPNPCTNGSCCDPVTGQCGNCPCAGIVCPIGQECSDGQCGAPQMGTGGDGGGSSSSTNAGGSSNGPTTSTTGGMGNGGGGGSEKVKGIWGLATGGGGCACNVVDTSSGTGAWMLLAAAVIAGMRRRRGQEAV